MLLVPSDLRPLPARLPHVLLLAVCLLDTFAHVATRPMGAAVQELVPRNPPHTREPPTEPGLYLQRYGSFTPGAVKLCLFSMDDLYHQIVCSPPPLLAGWYPTGAPIFIGEMEFINKAHRDYVFGELGKNPSGGSREAEEAQKNPWEWANGKVIFLSLTHSGLQGGPDGGPDEERNGRLVISETTMNNNWKPTLLYWTHGEDIEVVYYGTGHVGIRVGAGYKQTFSPTTTGAPSDPPNGATPHWVFTARVMPLDEDVKQYTLSEALNSAMRTLQAAEWFGELGLWHKRRPNWPSPWVRVDNFLECLSKRAIGFTSNDLATWRHDAGIIMKRLHEPRGVSSEHSH